MALLFPFKGSIYFLVLVHLQYCGAILSQMLKYTDVYMPVHLHHGERIEMLPGHRKIFCWTTQILIKASLTCYLVLSG